MKSKPNQQPKDLGIKIGSKEEAFWKSVREKAEEEIINNQHEMIINNAIIELAAKKIEEEKHKI